MFKTLCNIVLLRQGNAALHTITSNTNAQKHVRIFADLDIETLCEIDAETVEQTIVVMNVERVIDK